MSGVDFDSLPLDYLVTLFDDSQYSTTQQHTTNITQQMSSTGPAAGAGAGGGGNGLFELSLTDVDAIATSLLRDTHKDGVFTETEATKAWNACFRYFGVTDNAAKQQLMTHVLWYACMNTTSTQQEFSGKIPVGSREFTMRDVIAALEIQPTDWRRFIRAVVNVRMIETLLRNERLQRPLRARAAAQGIGTENFRAVLDFFDAFENPSSSERAAFTTLSTRRLRPDTTRGVIRAAQLHTEEYNRSSQPPAPSSDAPIGW